MFRFVFALILIAGSVAVSYRYSDLVYGFYVKNWYTRVAVYNREQGIKKMNTLLEKKEWKDLRDAGRIHGILHPDDPYALVILARAELAKENRDRAAAIYLKVAHAEKSDAEIFSEAVSYLASINYYGDLVPLLTRNRRTLSGDQLTILGIGLYREKKFADSLSALEDGRRLGHERFENYLHAGLASAALGDHQRALGYFLSARSFSPRDERTIQGLVMSYKALGKFEEAEKIIRQKLR